MEKKKVMALCYTWMINEDDYKIILDSYRGFAEKENEIKPFYGFCTEDTDQPSMPGIILLKSRK